MNASIKNSSCYHDSNVVDSGAGGWNGSRSWAVSEQSLIFSFAHKVPGFCVLSQILANTS